MPPVTLLSHLTLLLEHLLLGLDDVALPIGPLACRNWSGTLAFLLAELVRYGKAGADELDYGDADFNAHGFGARLADFSTFEFFDRAEGYAGAVGYRQRTLGRGWAYKRVVLIGESHE